MASMNVHSAAARYKRYVQGEDSLSVWAASESDLREIVPVRCILAEKRRLKDAELLALAYIFGRHRAPGRPRKKRKKVPHA